jgi:uncharacterized protein (TIGR04255 family)
MSWSKYRSSITTPKQIDTCPIVDTSLEFRFQSELPNDAVFGRVHAILSEFGEAEVENLPILDIPPNIRDNDAGLIYQGHYRIKLNEYIVLVGPKVINFSSPKPYVGWTEYSEFFFPILTRLLEEGIVRIIQRIGVRYINAFQDNVWDKLCVQVRVIEEEFPSETKVFESNIPTGSARTRIKISEKAKMDINGKTEIVSVLDLDTSISGSFTLKDGLEDLVNSIHLEEKKTFFALLTKEAIEEFKPIYL